MCTFVSIYTVLGTTVKLSTDMILAFWIMVIDILYIFAK